MSTPLLGRRTAIEFAFLVAVPFAAWKAGAGIVWIIAPAALAYLLVLAVEVVLWRRAEQPAPAVAPAAEATAPAAAEHVRGLRAEPEPEPVAAEEPQPEPVRAPEPIPAVAQVVPSGAAQAPRQWNIWDLEQLARAHTSGDPVADEERTFLLLYLRDFAGADGLLPIDFDDLVRQSFGALVANR